MSDIVERLRELSPNWDQGHIAGIYRQAADEIERLRAALKEAHQLRRACADEIDGLREFAAERGFDLESYYDPWKGVVEE